jgi:hypothetical protein
MISLIFIVRQGSPAEEAALAVGGVFLPERFLKSASEKSRVISIRLIWNSGNQERIEGGADYP